MRNLQEIEMETKAGLTKRDILRHFLSAGINITPNSLNILYEKSLTSQDLEEIIRKISYLPDFDLLVTESLLKILSTEKKDPAIPETSPSPSAIDTDQLDLEEEFPESSEDNSDQEHKNTNKTEKKSREIPEISELEDDGNNIGPKNDQFSPTGEIEENEYILTPQSIRSEGIRRFKPVAKDYSEQIQILKDSNSNLYTNGSIEDFIAQFQDRFNQLSDILLQNPEVKNILPINQVNGLNSSGNVNIIGMVVDKRPTRSGSAIKFSMDDQTGQIDVIVRNDERNAETYDNMNYLLKDHVIFVSGFLKVDLSSRRRTFYANKIIWPDVPLGHRSHIPSCPVSFALISDLHIGSDNFLEDVFTRFTKYLKGEVGTSRDQEEAGKIKYLIVCGDLVDGIGIYADQQNELKITDIFKQYEKAAELFAQIPDYINIIYIPGNHEPVRKAIPHPTVPLKYSKPFIDLGVTALGDPALVELHGIKFLLYHGDGIIDMNNHIPGLSNNKPTNTMKEMLRCRHLSPTFGKECTEKAPSAIDWLTIDQVPHVFHTGHMHINDLGEYRNVLLVNSGCFQAQTKFMKSLGINPTPGKVPIISEEYGKLRTITLTLR
jgi:DNA polymerase II small subunit